MTKNEKQKKASSKDGDNQAPSQNKPQLKCILHFKDPKPNDSEIKAKFYKADNSEGPNKSCALKQVMFRQTW
jgi:hypothetical protein